MSGLPAAGDDDATTAGATTTTKQSTSTTPALAMIVENEKSLPPRPKPNVSGRLLESASTVADVRAALAALHAREATLAARLDGLVSSHHDIARELGRLDLLRAGLGAQVIAARTIGNDMLAGAADTAGRLSDRVRELDLEKSRVEETLGVVEQVAELKACVHGVVGSMGAPQDWEAAAGYLSRAGSRVPDGIMRSGFAASVVPSVEVPDPPWVTLENAKESLCGLFLREFEAAARAGDGAKVTRFFKLFPLIGRGDVGLDVYGRYVCQGVAGTARETLREGPPKKEGFFYVNALTRLFEHIAQIVDSHGALVERHYGAGRMARVIERLQAEADVQGGIVLDSWADERAIERRLTDVRSYPFSFLVQSFHMPPQRAGTPRVNSPAGASGSTNANARNSEDEGVDMKEVDGLLTEISVMLHKWSLYVRFVAGKCRDPNATPPEAPHTVPDLITKSNLHKKVSSKLATPYNVMTTFLFRRSVEKAFQLDEPPAGLSLNMSRPVDSSPPFIISAVDVVMYIVSAVLQKTLTTSQKDVVASVVPTLGRVLGSDFVGMIQRKMRDESYPKPSVAGGLPPEDKVIAFVVLINSLEMANEYLGRLITSRLGVNGDGKEDGGPGSAGADANQAMLRDSFPFERDADFIVASLRNLQSAFVSKTTELLNEGILVLFNQVVKPRLRPMLSDTFRDADYSLTEDDMAELAAQRAEDPDAHADVAAPGVDDDQYDVLMGCAVRRFEHGWDQLMRPVARIMCPRPYALLLDSAARTLAGALERRVWGYAGRTSAFGAVRMERDFGRLVDVVARGNYGMRELFARVSQVLMVVNMEEEEWEELVVAGDAAGEDEGGFLWVLTEDERKKARALVRT